MILVVNRVSHNEQLMRRALASGRAAQHSRDIGEKSIALVQSAFQEVAGRERTS
jgi:hypothetical protein